MEKRRVSLDRYIFKKYKQLRRVNTSIDVDSSFEEIKQQLLEFDSISPDYLQEVQNFIVQHRDHSYVDACILNLIWLESFFQVCRIGRNNRYYLSSSDNMGVQKSHLSHVYANFYASIWNGTCVDTDKTKFYFEMYDQIVKLKQDEQCDDQIAQIAFCSKKMMRIIIRSLFCEEVQRVLLYDVGAETDGTLAFVLSSNNYTIHIVCDELELVRKHSGYILSHELEHLYQKLQYPHTRLIKTGNQKEAAAEAAACEKTNCHECLTEITRTHINKYSKPYFCAEEDFFPYWKDLILQRKVCDKHRSQIVPLIQECSYEWIDKNIDRTNLPQLLRKHDAELQRLFNQRIHKIRYDDSTM